MDTYIEIGFVFSSKHRILRHVVFWIVHTIIFTLIWNKFGPDLLMGFVVYLICIPMHMLYCYPIMYWIIPRYLIKEKFFKFTLLIVLWAIAGWYFNYLFRAFIFIPFEKYVHFNILDKALWAPGSFMAMCITACITGMIVLFKYWVKKQNDYLQAEQEKITAELQLLKAQVHPHFLFNTLNNIYSFSLENSPKTSSLILKLSALMKYILYDCKTDEVLLEKEINVMKDYINLEKERYGNKLQVSINIEGDIKNKFIAPLLLLPFLENAFKHGTSQQLKKPSLSMNMSIKNNTLKCKIVNSKNNEVDINQNGIGITNVKNRLSFLYQGKHELKISDEPNFFIVSLLIHLKEPSVNNIIKRRKYAPPYFEEISG